MANKLDVLVLEGDGIGPEVTGEALRVLKRAADAVGLQVSLEHALFGGCAIDQEGGPVSQKTLDAARKADAVLLGAVGGPKWDDLPTAKRPEKGLLAMRKHLEVFANLRPAKLFSALADSSPLKNERADSFDFIVIRELVGGIYFGEPREASGEKPNRQGLNTLVYTEDEIERIGRIGFETARLRRKKLLSVDKANVLEVMGVWRKVMSELGEEYPDVELEHMYVDNCAMQLILRPADFDVLVTGNMFGDILSDLAAAATGSIGLLPSASLGEQCALYEPVHGSAPDIAGQGKANPLAAILSVAMMLEHTAKQPELAGKINQAVTQVLDKGYRTGDLGKAASPDKQVGTRAMADAVLSELDALL